MSKDSQAFKKDIVFRMIKWGFDKFSFTAKNLFVALDLNWDKRSDSASLKEKWVWDNLFVASQQDAGSQWVGRETIFKCLNPVGEGKITDGTVFCLTTEAKFKYIDFLELEQARENSESAQKNALAAQRHSRTSIKIAVGALIVSGVGVILQTILTLCLQPK